MCDCFDDSLFCIAVVFAGTLQLAFGVLFAGNRAAFFIVAYQLAFQFVVFVLRIGAQKAVVVKFFGRPVRNFTQQFQDGSVGRYGLFGHFFAVYIKRLGGFVYLDDRAVVCGLRFGRGSHDGRAVQRMVSHVQQNAVFVFFGKCNFAGGEVNDLQVPVQFAALIMFDGLGVDVKLFHLAFGQGAGGVDKVVVFVQKFFGQRDGAVIAAAFRRDQANDFFFHRLLSF